MGDLRGLLKALSIIEKVFKCLSDALITFSNWHLSGRKREKLSLNTSTGSSKAQRSSLEKTIRTGWIDPIGVATRILHNDTRDYP
jgi:hypothetical protein